MGSDGAESELDLDLQTGGEGFGFSWEEEWGTNKCGTVEAC